MILKWEATQWWHSGRDCAWSLLRFPRIEPFKSGIDILRWWSLTGRQLSVHWVRDYMDIILISKDIVLTVGNIILRRCSWNGRLIGDDMGGRLCMVTVEVSCDRTRPVNRVILVRWYGHWERDCTEIVQISGDRTVWVSRVILGILPWSVRQLGSDTGRETLHGLYWGLLGYGAIQASRVILGRLYWNGKWLSRHWEETAHTLFRYPKTKLFWVGRFYFWKIVLKLQATWWCHTVSVCIVTVNSYSDIQMHVLLCKVTKNCIIVGILMIELKNGLERKETRYVSYSNPESSFCLWFEKYLSYRGHP